MIKLFLYLLSVILTAFGFSFAIIYLNVMAIGFNLLEYLKLLFTRPETFSIIIGIGLFLILQNKRYILKQKVNNSSKEIL